MIDIVSVIQIWACTRTSSAKTYLKKCLIKFATWTWPAGSELSTVFNHKNVRTTNSFVFCHLFDALEKAFRCPVLCSLEASSLVAWIHTEEQEPPLLSFSFRRHHNKVFC
ncbi:hypothetical protein OUZ56_000128 [Daphnia magna]|uniref:Uncharacterized protein n=1 Tax=Daphnia magna TaxID=35525 RepID=A0ABQ9ZZI7_9CRUS|nr:hypothetical protein OUZ56_000128 [Daphnia magna]